MDETALLHKCSKAPNIIIFGAGYYAMQITFYLQGNGIEVMCYCVSKANDNPSIYLGRPVICIDTLVLNDNVDQVIVAVNSMHHHEISLLLEKKI